MRHVGLSQAPGGQQGNKQQQQQREVAALPPPRASPDTPLDAAALGLPSHGSSENLRYEWSIDAATDDIIVKPVVPAHDPAQEVLSIWDASW